MPTESRSPPPPQILDGLDPTCSPFRKCLYELQKTCSSRTILPATYEVSGALTLSTTEVAAYGGFCDVYKGSLDGSDVCIKRLRISATGDRALVKQVPHHCSLRLHRHALTNLQALCKEAVMWKHLDHPNIVPFNGVTFEPLQLVSEWTPGGELREYIRNNCQTNLIGLVSPLLHAANCYLILSLVTRRCQRSRLSSLVQRDPWGPQRST